MRTLIYTLVLSASLFSSSYGQDCDNFYINIREGQIFIYEKKSNKLIESAKMASEYKGESSNIKLQACYIDLNLDGKKDLAILDGNYGSSDNYIVLLKSNNSFVYNKELSSNMFGTSGFTGYEAPAS